MKRKNVLCEKILLFAQSYPKRLTFSSISISNISNSLPLDLIIPSSLNVFRILIIQAFEVTVKSASSCLDNNASNDFSLKIVLDKYNRPSATLPMAFFLR